VIGIEERKIGERAVVRERERVWAEVGRGQQPIGFRGAAGRGFGGEYVREERRTVFG
jgi:hypothetical protein